MDVIIHVDTNDKDIIDSLKELPGGTKTVETAHFEFAGEMVALITPASAALAAILREWIRIWGNVKIAENKIRRDVKITVKGKTFSLTNADAATLEKFFRLIEQSAD